MHGMQALDRIDERIMEELCSDAEDETLYQENNMNRSTDQDHQGAGQDSQCYDNFYSKDMDSIEKENDFKDPNIEKRLLNGHQLKKNLSPQS